jgi:hypothetical protein
MSMPSSLDAQIAEVEYELAMRRRVYPHQVATRKMTQGEADLHIARMQDVIETLRTLRGDQR